MDIALLLNEATVKFEPGSKFEYSNSGYVLLKAIAEIAGQRSYSDLLQQEIFGPADMTSSGVARNLDNPKLAKGYQDATQTNPVKIDFPLENLDGAGSVYSTPEDLYKLDQALRTEKFFSNKVKELMLKQHVPERFSYGWFVRARWHLGCVLA